MRDDAAYVVLASGAWIPVANSGSVSQELADVATESTSLTGERRLLVPAGQARTRSWSVSVKDVPSWGADVLGVLEWLSLTKTTFGWVPPLARLGNGLQQEWNTTRPLRPAIVSGVPGMVPDSTDEVWSGDAPVRPGRNYTFSVNLPVPWAGSVQAWFIVNGKAAMAGALGKATGTRRWGTFQAPDGATAGRLWVSTMNPAVNAPAITESDNLRAYVPPQGCAQAVATLGAFDYGTGLGRGMKASYELKVKEVA